MNASIPTLSVIVPMYNAQHLIDRCLAPLLAMQARGEVAQVIVVDDCATDGSAARVRAYPTVELTRTPAQGGPGAARNLGATLATGTHLWFVDSDVIVADDAARVLRETLATSGAAAVIGSYDDRPAADNFLSQYKNLVHHYYHHRGKADASTFWGGCGAVDRALFLRLGGFDARRYRYPSIEDIEFGYRIGDAGGRIVLEPRLQGKHLKEWRFVNLVHTEVFRRALPWTRLMLERKDVTNDLNVGWGERARAVLALATMAALLGFAVRLLPWWAPAALVVAVVVANADFLGFFVRTRGLVFALRALAFHQFYYAYSSAAFAWATFAHYLSRRSPSVPASG